MTRTRCVGHRGAMAHAIENTLPSIELAIAQGAHAVEIDVWVHERGELIVFHDETLERLAGRKERVASLEFDALRALDLGDGVFIPTLAEVLELTHTRCEVNIELKGPDTAAALATLLAATPHIERDRLLVSSFSMRELEVAMALFARVRRGVLAERVDERTWAQVERVQAFSVHPHHEQVDAALLASARARGVEVHCWTVNDPARMKQLVEDGVDAIITDYPDRFPVAVE